MSIEEDPEALNQGDEELVADRLNGPGKENEHNDPAQDEQHQQQEVQKPPPHQDTLHPLEHHSTSPSLTLPPSDPSHPLNWPLRRKLYITALTSLTTLTVTFTSSIFSATIAVTAAEFGVSDVVMLLGVSLFVLGFALGPLLWGPLSEVYGRKPPIYTGLLLFALFQIPVGVAQNLPTIFVSRFIAGVGGSAPLAINSAMFADFFTPVQRGTAAAVYSSAVFVGPMFGPIVGALVTERGGGEGATFGGWRWTAWIPLMLISVFGGLGWVTVRESYPPVLLKRRRAKELRQERGGVAMTTRSRNEHEQQQAPSLTTRKYTETYLLTPIKMIIQEPILIAITVYISTIYGLLYLTFVAVPLSFAVRGWGPVQRTLPFLSLFVGVLLGAAVQVVFTNTWYQRRLRARGGRLLPEDRLPLMFVGGVALVVGLFWFGWTAADAGVESCVPQVLAGVPLGFGIQLVFICGIAYIVDVYLLRAASAIAVNTFVRSAVAAGFPLFAPALYRRLGVPWATSLLGFLGVALLPCPVLFWIYGKKLRGWSKFAPPGR